MCQTGGELTTSVILNISNNSNILLFYFGFSLLSVLIDDNPPPPGTTLNTLDTFYTLTSSKQR